MEEAELLEVLDDVSPEYAAAAVRYFGDKQGHAWIAQLRGQPMARVAIRPNWVGILDFQTPVPKRPEALEPVELSRAGPQSGGAAHRAELDPAGKHDGRQQAPVLVADRPGNLDPLGLEGSHRSGDVVAQ